MKLTCKMMVPTKPDVGASDRNPQPHQCKRPIYADGYCATHNADYQAQRKAEKAARNARTADPQNQEPTAAQSLRRLADLLEKHGDVLQFSANQQRGEPLSVGLDGRPTFSKVLTIRVEYEQRQVSLDARPDQPLSG